MLSLFRRLLSQTGQDRGFTLIELLIVVLIVGILAAVGTPIYLNYVRDAKSAEGKGQAGALWTAIQTTAIADCTSAPVLTTAYGKAGFDSAGVTSDARWKVSGGGGLTVDCTNGKYTAGTIFTLLGQKSDITNIKVELRYDPATEPPSQLWCDLSGAFSTC